MDTEAAPNQMDDSDINTLKAFDVEVERALRELERKVPGI